MFLVRFKTTLSLSRDRFLGVFLSLPLPLDALMVGLLVQVHSGLLLGVPEVGLLDETGHVELGGVGDLLSHQGFLGH